MYITVNVETVPPVGSAPDPNLVTVPANYSNPDTIAKYKAKEALKQWEALAKEPQNAQPICICWSVDDDDPSIILSNNEEDLFRKFNEVFKGILAERDGFTPIIWITYNGLRFDYPILFTRAVKWGCEELAKSIQTPRWGNDYHKDVMTLLGGVGSLDEWLHTFGIELDNPITGSQISTAFLKQQHDQITRHSKSRVAGAWQLYKRILAVGCG